MIDVDGKRLILASASARRAHLLRLLGLEFEIQASGVEEDEEAHLMPEVHVLELAQKKAERVAENIKEGLVVGADTIVVVDHRILGKPSDPREAHAMLRLLSGRPHEVYTGFALVDRPSGRTVSDYERTRVYFRDLSDEEIARYVATESPMDKAGAYGIQDLSAVFVTRIEGCFYNVVGLPLAKFYRTAQAFLT